MTSNKVALTEKHKQLIQKLGVNMERSGMTPAEARIAAFLVVSPQNELTFDEIMDTMNITKSATSNAINKLLMLREIEYVTKHGDRKRYFRSNIDDWSNRIMESFNRVGSLTGIYKEVLESRPKATKEFNKHLQDFIGFLNYLSSELPALHDKWQKRK